jgi:hypothetical protein
MATDIQINVSAKQDRYEMDTANLSTDAVQAFLQIILHK